MGWSIKLFDVGGTAVRIHLTFFLLLAWIAAIRWSTAWISRVSRLESIACSVLASSPARS